MVPLRRHHVLTSMVTLFGAAASYRYRCLLQPEPGRSRLGAAAIECRPHWFGRHPRFSSLRALSSRSRRRSADQSHSNCSILLWTSSWLSVAVLMTPVGLGRLLDLPINIHIDGTGIEGWPFWPDQDRTWESIKAARRLRGVITLPFPDPLGLRRGWVVIPERALSQQQRVEFNELLESRGLLKPSR